MLATFPTFSRDAVSVHAIWRLLRPYRPTLNATDTAMQVYRCPVCKTGHMVRTASIGPNSESRWIESGPPWEDTS